MPDALRLAVGTFTVLPVPPPRRVTASTARGAMLLAPLVGLALGLVAATVAVGWRWAAGAGAATDLVAAVLAVGALALGTRGLHLDGLADTVDGLGSGRRGADAVAVMRRSDVGPFGVAAVVLVLLLQVSALAACLAAAAGPAALVVAVVTGRTALLWACRRGVPAARTDGLGAAVAGTVPVAAAAAGTLVVVAAAAAVGWWQAGTGGGLLAVGAVGAGIVAAALLVRRAARRFGGVTGDVYGAVVEVATTAALLVLSLG